MITKEQYDKLRPVLDEFRYPYGRRDEPTKEGLPLRLLPKLIKVVNEYENGLVA